MAESLEEKALNDIITNQQLMKLQLTDLSFNLSRSANFLDRIKSTLDNDVASSLTSILVELQKLNTLTGIIESQRTEPEESPVSMLTGKIPDTEMTEDSLVTNIIFNSTIDSLKAELHEDLLEINKSITNLPIVLKDVFNDIIATENSKNQAMLSAKIRQEEIDKDKKEGILGNIFNNQPEKEKDNFSKAFDTLLPITNKISDSIANIAKHIEYLTNPAVLTGVLGGAIAIGVTPLAAAIVGVGAIVGYVAYQLLKPISDAISNAIPIITEKLQVLDTSLVNKALEYMLVYLKFKMTTAVTSGVSSALSMIPGVGTVLGNVVGAAGAIAAGGIALSSITDIDKKYAEQANNQEIKEPSNAIKEQLHIADVVIDFHNDVMNQYEILHDDLNDIKSGVKDFIESQTITEALSKLSANIDAFKNAFISYKNDQLTKSYIASSVSAPANAYNTPSQYSRDFAMIEPTDAIATSSEEGSAALQLERLRADENTRHIEIKSKFDALITAVNNLSILPTNGSEDNAIVYTLKKLLF